jgi:hypothetical protein
MDRTVATKAQRAGTSVEQTDLGEGWNHVVRARLVFKAFNLPLTQISLPNRSRKRLSKLK